MLVIKPNDGQPVVAETFFLNTICTEYSHRATPPKNKPLFLKTVNQQQ